MTEHKIYNPAITAIKKGITLIEASAGTGKTFAISMLVLRAVSEREIPIDRILVVTFTVAATEELRDRIRSRINQGLNYLLGNSDEHDEVLGQWAVQLKDRKRAVHLLRLALFDVDRAGIFTIHGFCQRMLTEQALASGQLFDTELTGDARLIKSELMRDFWRSRLYSLPSRYCQLLTSSYKSPEALYQSIRGADDPLVTLVPETNSLSVEAVCESLENSLVLLAEWWVRDGEQMNQCLEKAENCGFLKKELKTSYPDHCSVLTSSLAQGDLPPAESVSWLTRENLLAGLNGSKLKHDAKQDLIAGWPLSDKLVLSYLEHSEKLILAFRLELAAWVRGNLSKRLENMGLMSFDDLINRLAVAVSDHKADELRRLIGQRYRMALIDEFQDTDSGQWTIFYQLFGSKSHILYLIGDPKQAIYRFRGADIFSYFNARKRADSNFTLSHNFRSNPDLIHAVNTLFDGCTIAGTPYNAITPAKTHEDGQLKCFGQRCAAMIYCQLEPFSERKPQWSSSAANSRIKQWVVSETVKLLNEQEVYTKNIAEQTGTIVGVPLQPADIAVLVRTHLQAEEYQRDLAEAGIAAVISSKTNVFSTEDCGYLMLVLQSLALPGDIKNLKAALSCDWFGLSAEQFLVIVNDDEELNRWLERFRHYHTCWLEDGFLAMFYRFLNDEKVLSNICSANKGERRIANIQHLAELVQEAEQNNRFGLSQTIMWLQKMNSGRIDMQETELRLESDAEAVKILTMHSAKGLEFPIVFCPFLMLGSRPPKEEIPVTRCHDSEGRLVVDIGSTRFNECRQMEKADEWEEDLRLCYVAVTRAKLRCYLFWCDVGRVGKYPSSLESPFAALLFSDGAKDFESQKQQLEVLSNQAGTKYCLIGREPEEFGRVREQKISTVFFETRSKGSRSLKTNRLVTSFSGLASTSFHHEEVLPGAFDEGGIDLAFSQISKLPGGVRFGNIVHDALEQIQFSDLAAGTEKEFLAGLCRRYGLDIDIDILAHLLKNIVITDLFDDNGMKCESFSLSDLDRQKMIKEMGFTLPLKNLDTGKINDILAGELTCTAISVKQVEGFLTGFVDLICHYEGRYYVVDYKTNYLGDGPLAYRRESMEAAMRMHNYGLQYWLYTLVVHRYLSRWVPGYTYDQNFGGVMYLFVRGMVPETPGSGVFHTIPDYGVLDRLDTCFKKGRI